jgi:hypothetical protein
MRKLRRKVNDSFAAGYGISVPKGVSRQRPMALWVCYGHVADRPDMGVSIVMGVVQNTGFINIYHGKSFQKRMI